MPKILLIEDNELNREIIERRLGRRGFDVVSAVDAEQGMEMAISESPDLILMDLRLPVIDGLEATRRLKAAPETSAIPIIALTADAMIRDRDQALEAGCDDYETKPVRIPKLLEKINALLPGASDS